MTTRQPAPEPADVSGASAASDDAETERPARAQAPAAAEAAAVDVVSLAELSVAPQPREALAAELDPLPAMAALPLVALDEDARWATLALGTRRLDAAIENSVDLSVLRTALSRKERVIVQREEGRWMILGALRTAATPGVDRGDDFTIEARRVRVRADHEFSVVSGPASFVLRAQGLIETLGQNITTRASSVHKIVGRLIRLN